MFRTAALFLTLISSTAISAQSITEGFYRVSNNGSGRYLYVRDCTGSLNDLEFGAIQLWAGLDNAISDPGSVMYFTPVTDDNGKTSWDITSQNTGVNAITGQTMSIFYSGTYCQVYKAGQYLYEIGEDEYVPGMGVIGAKTNTEMKGKTKFRNWTMSPISSSSANYFGFKPTVTAEGKNYASFYADFAYTPTNKNIKTYYVTKVDKERAVAVIKEIKGTVAKSQPVIIQCAGTSPSDNKVDLTTAAGTEATANLLAGVYFDNGERSSILHETDPAAVEFDASTMRLLGTNAYGRLSFVKTSSSLVNSYLCKDEDWEEAVVLPHNQAYLIVDEDCPATLEILTEEEYISTSVNNIAPTNTPSDIYTLSGIKTTTTQRGSMYIQNGRKYISK